jgi:hypothetical protein
MRIVILALAASSLALAGCGKKAATGNTSAIDQAVSAEDFATNDATAIDAATGADANMAADVDINVIENSDNGSASDASPRSKPRAQSASSNSDNAEPAAAPDEPTATPAEGNAD